MDSWGCLGGEGLKQRADAREEGAVPEGFSVCADFGHEFVDGEGEIGPFKHVAVALGELDG